MNDRRSQAKPSARALASRATASGLLVVTIVCAGCAIPARDTGTDTVTASVATPRVGGRGGDGAGPAPVRPEAPGRAAPVAGPNAVAVGSAGPAAVPAQPPTATPTATSTPTATPAATSMPTATSTPGLPAATAAPGAQGAALTSPAATRRPGAYYQDDGPGERLMALAGDLADAEPRAEPLHPRANRPYQIFGRDYVPLTERREFRERGVASWYGRKFHGQPTSTGEPYDMYAMTGAHPTLPLPSFVRVTNRQNGRAVVVRINDRGPFLKDRVIDLSAAAAWRLGYYDEGSAPVEVELIGTAVTTEGQEALRLLRAPAGAEAAAAATGAGAGATESADAGAGAVSPAAAAPAGAAGAAPAGATAEPSSSPSPAPRFAHYVQLAAFGSRGAAEAAQRRLQLEFDWLEAPVRVIENAAVYRVQAGPFDVFQRARDVATRVERVTGQRPWIVARP